VTDLPFDVPHELFPVEHRFTEVDGALVHFVDEGAGGTLLLLHGNPSWSFLYRKMIPVLRDSFRCVAVDYPGYGMSGTPAGYGFTPAEHSAFLEKFVDQLGLSDLTIMVQDWGGPIGLGLAARRPELVRALVIGNTFAWPLNGNWRIEVFSWVMGGPIGRIGTRAFNLVPRFFLSRGLARDAPPQVIRMYLAPWHDPARRKAAVIAPRQLIKATAYLRHVESGLSALASIPALIVWGTADFAFRDKERERFERAFPDHTSIQYRDASHFLQEDVGEQIAEQVKIFLRGPRTT
jgi:haloalkane dehalogenase